MVTKSRFCIFVALFCFLCFPAWGVSIDFGDDLVSNSRRIFQLIVVLTALSLAPSLLIMVTSFTRIVIVLSFLRNAIGLQQSPPNSVMISLALFMTFFIMSPVFEKSYKEGIVPYSEGKMEEEVAWKKTTDPFHAFMLKHTKEKDLQLFYDLSEQKKPETPEEVSLTVLTPAFMIGELRRAFEIGFLIFMPFLIIDLLVASVLMSMGMMMLPPVAISLPFKVIFFVLIDGWQLLIGSMIRGFG